MKEITDMKEETKLMIQNQLITNQLLKTLVVLAISDYKELRLEAANQTNEVADDMVKSRLAFEKLID